MRKWQTEALEKYRQLNRRDFLVTATPGAGKTRFALTLARKLLDANAIQHVIIVAPTDHLRTQWSETAADFNIFLDPNLSNSEHSWSTDYDGYVATYSQIGLNPTTHARRTRLGRTLVIFDEIHHAGDGLNWGDGLKEAFCDATRRLSLTGTPFRTGANPIPFITYTPSQDGTKTSQSDYTYGYGDALKDNVVRPVVFAAFTGQVSWTDTINNETVATTLNEVGDKDVSLALKACLNPNSQWIREVLSAANDRLTQTRTVFPDAGGMILAGDKETAKKYAQIIEQISGDTPTVVLSDDNKASQKISAFRDGTQKWLVAVRMVSEGVDVPRLMVGVWATNYRTPLFFAQAIGRFVRSRRRGEGATVFLPAIKPLIALASEMEKERRHYISTLTNITEDMREHNFIQEAGGDSPDTLTYQDFLSTGQFDHIMFNGKAIDDSQHIELTPEEEEYLGLPELLSPQQMMMLLKKRSQEMSEVKESLTSLNHTKNVGAETMRLRKEISRNVSRIALRNGEQHSVIHTKSRQAVPGPPSRNAPINILERRLEWLQQH